MFNEVLDDKDPSWSPDGSKIAFDSNKAGTRDVWILLLFIKEARK
jgi:Tol biopolymer transport system component